MPEQGRCHVTCGSVRICCLLLFASDSEWVLSWRPVANLSGCIVEYMTRSLVDVLRCQTDPTTFCLAVQRYLGNICIPEECHVTGSTHDALLSHVRWWSDLHAGVACPRPVRATWCLCWCSNCLVCSGWLFWNLIFGPPEAPTPGSAEHLAAVKDFLEGGEWPSSNSPNCSGAGTWRAVGRTWKPNLSLSQRLKSPFSMHTEPLWMFGEFTPLPVVQLCNGHRGNTYLTSRPLVSVRRHGHVTQWKSRWNFTSSASSIFLVHNLCCDKCI